MQLKTHRYLSRILIVSSVLLIAFAVTLLAVGSSIWLGIMVIGVGIIVGFSTLRNMPPKKGK